MGEAAPPATLAVVPVYNHAATLRSVVEGLVAQGLPVLVVDDGSTDDPLGQVRDLAVTGLRRERNQGKGATLLEGARWAQAHGFAAMLTVDADGQHHPEDAPLLLAAARTSWPAIVLGSRDFNRPHVPASSRFGRAFSNFWVRLECGRTLQDTQSGYRVYPTDFLTRTRFWTRRYTFEVEVLVRAAWAGLPILQCPVGVTYQPGAARISHFHAFRDNLRLSVLHTGLVIRALLPFPRGPLDVRAESRALLAEARSALFHPLRFLRRLTQEHASPLELATAVGVGVFVGTWPIIPFGLSAILYVAHRLHLNKLAAAGASNLCVAPFVPFLCIQMGHLLRQGTFWRTFTRQTLLQEIHLRLWEWLLGALTLGPLLALLAAVPTYFLLKRMGKSQGLR